MYEPICALLQGFELFLETRIRISIKVKGRIWIRIQLMQILNIVHNTEKKRTITVLKKRWLPHLEPQDGDPFATKEVVHIDEIFT